MKNPIQTIIAAFLVSLAALAMPRIAAANAGACYGIVDNDARNLCLAKARKDAMICYNISSAGLRAMCLGEVK